MIDDVSESLRCLFAREALDGTDVDVVFDAPTKEWSTRRNAPTLDVFLYDIREDLSRRAVGRSDRRDEDGTVTRSLPPRWFKLSYLVTAWTQRPEDEHRLLSLVLGCLIRQDSLPADVLVGTLEGSTSTISYTCAVPPQQDRALSDTWSALGGELKPSLDLVVTAPFDLQRLVEAGPPVLEPLRLGVRTTSVPEGAAEEPPRRGRKRASSAAPREPETGDVRVGGDADQRGRIFRVREVERSR